MKRILLIWFAGMMAIHANVAWRVRDLIPKGLPDFTIFYTAAQILHHGHSHRLYDNTLQEQIQRSFAPDAFALRGSLLPYNHPPFEAPLFLPLAYFPYLTSYFLWMLVNLVLLFFTLRLLRRNTEVLSKLPLYLWCLGALAFCPIFLALIQGQDSMLLLFCYTAAYAAFRRGAATGVGAWLAAGLFKFNLVLPFSIVFPRVRSKLLRAFLLVAVLLIAAGVLLVGWHSALSYPSYVWQAEHNANYLWNGPSSNMANLRGILSILPVQASLLQNILVALCSAMVLFFCARTLRHGLASSSFGLSFAINLAATVLVSYHIMPHDLSLVFLVVVLSLDAMLSTPYARRTPSIVAYVCMALLFFSPMYLVAIFRYHQARLIGVVTFVLFGSLIVLSRHTTKDSLTT